VSQKYHGITRYYCMGFLGWWSFVAQTFSYLYFCHIGRTFKCWFMSLFSCKFEYVL